MTLNEARTSYKEFEQMYNTLGLNSRLQYVLLVIIMNAKRFETTVVALLGRIEVSTLIFLYGWKISNKGRIGEV
jgi:hypothetical protein